MNKKPIYVNSLLNDKDFPRYWNSKKCEYAKNYPVYIHKIEIDENAIDLLSSLCRYGAKKREGRERQKGTKMLWIPDFSWWVSENPKARVEGMEKGCWGQFAKLPPKTQLARDIINKDIISAHESPFYKGKI